MSLRLILPAIIIILMLPGPLGPTTASPNDDGLTVKWTRSYNENITYMQWFEDQVRVYSLQVSGSACVAVRRDLDPATGNETAVWRQSCEMDQWLEDLDGDGRDEGIVAGQFWKPQDVYKMDLYKYGQTIPYASYTSAKVGEYIFPEFDIGDLNGNGYKDIALWRYMKDEKDTATEHYRVFHDKRLEIRDGRDLSLIWGLDLDDISSNQSSGAMWDAPPFDGNSDGKDDLLLFLPQPGADTTFYLTGYLYDGGTGNVLWNTSTDWSCRGTYLMDVDKDGSDEIVIFWKDGSVWGEDHDRFEIREKDGGLVRHPALGFNEIPGDGDLIDLGEGHGLVYFTANRTDTTHMRFEARDFLTWKLLFSQVLEGKRDWFPWIDPAHDYNSDGVPELLITGYKDYLLDGKTYKVLWTGPYDHNDRAFAYPFVGIYTYTATPYFQFPQIEKSITIEDYANGSIIWEGPKNGTLVFADIEDHDRDKDVELLLAVRNSPTNGTVTMYNFPKSMASTGPETPTTPDRKRFTTVEACTGPLLALLLMISLVIMTVLRRISKGDRP